MHYIIIWREEGFSKFVFDAEPNARRFLLKAWRRVKRSDRRKSMMMRDKHGRFKK